MQQHRLSDGLLLEQSRFCLFARLEHSEAGIHHKAYDLQQAAGIGIRTYGSEPALVAQLPHCRKQHRKPSAVDVGDFVQVEEDYAASGLDSSTKCVIERFARAVIDISSGLQEGNIS